MKRLFTISAAASPKTSPKVVVNIAKSNTKSKILLSTVDTKNPFSSITMALPLGCRYQNSEEGGISHALKASLFTVN